MKGVLLDSGEWRKYQHMERVPNLSKNVPQRRDNLAVSVSRNINKVSDLIITHLIEIESSVCLISCFPLFIFLFPYKK